MNLYFLFLLICVLLILSFGHNYQTGLGVSLFLLLLLPKELSIAMSGSVPNLTIHRLILMLLALFWILNKNIDKKSAGLPFIKAFCLLLSVNTISTLLATDIIVSFKHLLRILLEEMLFYVILATSLKEEKDIIRLLHTTCAALGMVAFIGWMENYGGFDIFDYLPVAKDVLLGDDRVASTYRHPILFGMAMSMGWPLSLILLNAGKGATKKFLLSLCCIFMLGGVYFSMSRGAWVSSIIAGCSTLILCRPAIRRMVICVIIMGSCLLVVRPGVMVTIGSSYEATFDINKVKGANFFHRLSLWNVAYSETSKSIETFLFGYGLASHRIAVFEAPYGSPSRKSKFCATVESWDNHYASTLVDSGFIGLGVFMLLNLLVVKLLVSCLWNCNEDYRNIVAIPISWSAVVVFMMTNVYIFVPQVKFLFWLGASIGVYFRRTNFYRISNT